MTNITDYKNPFDAITDFESALSKYTKAPYVVTTDCCSHAIELCFRYLQYKEIINSDTVVEIPNRTYLSVPMIFQILKIPFKIVDFDWKFEYQFNPFNIWDSARLLAENMYMDGQMQCLSFGRTKPLEIGRGGAILLDNKDAYKWLKKSSYDGRDLSYIPWENQINFNVGYHYMMRPEECIEGINKLNNLDISNKYNHVYPNLSNLNINVQ